MFRAERASVLINADTNMISVIVYSPINIIIIIVGNAKLRSDAPLHAWSNVWSFRFCESETLVGFALACVGLIAFPEGSDGDFPAYKNIVHDIIKKCFCNAAPAVLGMDA